MRLGVLKLAVLKNSDNISEEDRESPAFHQLVHKMSGKQSTLPIIIVGLCTPTRSDLHVGSLSLRASPGPSPHIRTSPGTSTHGHESEHSAAVFGRPTFKVNLAQPPRFTKITVNPDVASWLHKVARVCRLAGTPYLTGPCLQAPCLRARHKHCLMPQSKLL